MNIKYETNLNGSLPFLRALLYLIQSKQLNFTQFGFYITLISQVDFDKRHKHYGMIIRDDKEIAKTLTCNPSTIHKNRKALIKKGLLIENEEGITCVPNYYLYEMAWVRLLRKLPAEILQDIIVNPQKDIAEILPLIEKMQQTKAEKNDNLYVSSKGNSSLSTTDFTETDMKFIDDSLNKNDEKY